MEEKAIEQQIEESMMQRKKDNEILVDKELDKVNQAVIEQRKARAAISVFQMDVQKIKPEHMSMKIMKALRQNICDTYELHAYDEHATGRMNIHAAREVSDTIARWVTVDKVNTQKTTLGVEIRVFFRRVKDFNHHFEINKGRSFQRRVEREMGGSKVQL